MSFNSPKKRDREVEKETKEQENQIPEKRKEDEEKEHESKKIKKDITSSKEGEGEKEKKGDQQDEASPSVGTSSGVSSALVLWGITNTRRRIFLPSKANTFGGLTIEYVMIDSGCGSLLLPLQKGQVTEFLTRFPTDTFVWSINASRGTGSLHASTLHIKGKAGGNTIPIRLMADLLPKAPTFYVGYLRFHLCYEDAQELLDLAPQSTPLREPYQKNLRELIGRVNALRDHDSACVTERRTHALLGQSVIGQDNFAAIQHRGIFTLVDAATFSWDRYLDQLADIEAVRSRIDTREYNDLEDDDHDGDDEDIPPFVGLEDLIDECSFE